MFHYGPQDSSEYLSVLYVIKNVNKPENLREVPYSWAVLASSEYTFFGIGNNVNPHPPAVIFQ